MKNRRFICFAAIVSLVLWAGLTSADDRDLLRATGAPPHVLLVLDSGASMALNPQTNNINYIAAGDDEGGLYTTQMVEWYKANYDVDQLIYTPAELEDRGEDDEYAERGLGLGSDYEAVLTDQFNRGSKLPQAKRALTTLLDSSFNFNWGFSYYQKTNITVHYLNYIYEVTEIWDPDTGDVLTELSDGTGVNDPIRVGAEQNMQGNDSPPPVFPSFFGDNGDEAHVIDWNPTGSNSGTADEPDNNDIRFARFLVDASTGEALSEISPADRAAANLYYFPAYDWVGIPESIKGGFDGTSTWAEVATANSIDTTDPAWKGQVKTLALTALADNQIGSQNLMIMEGYQQYSNVVHQWAVISKPTADRCIDPDPNRCQDRRLATIQWKQPFVLYDYNLLDEGANNFTHTLSAQSWQGEATCVGYQNGDDGHEPIVPLSRPDPANNGDTVDQSELIKTYLGPQHAPVFYFPDMVNTSGYHYLPYGREQWIPLTETISAGGRRPIKDTIVEAGQYFGQEVSTWSDDPLGFCRSKFMIIVTDGMESCTNTNAPCQAATNIFKNQEVSVYVVYFGTEDNALNPDLSVVDCVATNSYGTPPFHAGTEEELLEALLKIGRDIEERTRGFSAPIVPSVETTTKQMAYISTFTPFQERSIWRGHLRAYPINPKTGVVADMRDNSPDPNTALWDAGDVLAARWDWGGRNDNPNSNGEESDQRAMFFTSDLGDNPARAAFSYPGDGDDSGDSPTDFEKREELGLMLFGQYPSVYDDGDDTTITDEQPEDRVKLRNTIDFMRGVQFAASGTDADGDPLGLRHIQYSPADPPKIPNPEPIWSSSYLWCISADPIPGDDAVIGCTEDRIGNPDGIEKLGDIFHSTPQRMAAPACFPCYLSDYQNYRADFLETHQYRRTVLFGGSNDGAMHAFDAGLWDIDGDTSMDPDQPPQYDAGTGRELFAWIPSAVMHDFPKLALTADQTWTVDGTATVADVFIDPDSVGPPTASDREWRSVLLFGLRRGGRSYTALDITQPDPYDGNGYPTPSGTVGFETRYSERDENSDPIPESAWPALTADHLSAGSGRDAGCANGGAGCSGAWPTFRWEFFDTSNEDAGLLNTEPDLGQTWSRPLVGFVRVTDGTDTEDRMVAFFGGGYSPLGATPPSNRVTGNFIYGVDVETGAILYKERVAGMVPGHVQGLDIDLDGFLEKIFFATTAGNVYRAKVGTPGVLSSGRVSTTWDPELIFDAPEHTETINNPDGTTTTKTSYQHFFMRPTLVPITFNADGTARLAIAIGSGDRDALFHQNPEPHRFYVFKEPADTTPVTALTEDDLEGMDIDFFDTNTNTENFLASTDVEGWYLELYENARLENWEKVNTGALVLNEYVIFSTFNPVDEISTVAIEWDEDGNPIRYACRRGGEARTYITSLYNANPQPGEELFIEHGDDTAMVTDPVVYLGADGKIHVIQATDNLELEEPIASFAAPVTMLNWKEN